VNKKIVVVGPGSWGTALSLVLNDNGHEVRLYGNDVRQIEEINTKHTNAAFLPNIVLPEEIKAYHNLKEAIENVDTVLLVVPTKVIRVVLKELKAIASTPLTIIHASKGIEPGTSKRISEIIEEEMPKELVKDIVVLSGPSHAEEVILRQPTTVTAASTNILAAEQVQDLFMNSYFRVYTNFDVIGVEIGGALKNIIALGAGISDGLGFGDNAKAALITRGLAEISRMGCELGANPLTFSGLTGVGDLIVTCTSPHSRNWTVGNRIGQGQDLDSILASMGMVAEGVRTTQAVHELSVKMGVQMPITAAIHGVLFEGRNAREAVEALMNRGGKTEVLTILK
jgi:glycerol-3-phosphate dehydrogenase (NAD(P)+)